MLTSFNILKKPRITEKGSRAAEGAPVVTFEVPVEANKIQIKEAVQRLFNVEVADVRTLVVRGKMKRRGRSVGKRPNWKKAIVKLAPGSEIDLFGGAGA